MTQTERLGHLRSLRAHFDQECPGWRDVCGPDGQPPRVIEVRIALRDGTEMRLVLHSRPEEVSEGGESWCE